MSGINKVILVGRMGKDPEVKQTRAGKEFSSFSMATSKKIGEEEKTTWHNVVVWNEHSAKYVNDFAQKGTLIYVEGEIDNRQYTKADGSTGYASDVVVGQYNGNVQILQDGVPRDGERGGRRPPAKAKPKEKTYEKESRGGADSDLDDEIPF